MRELREGKREESARPHVAQAAAEGLVGANAIGGRALGGRGIASAEEQHGLAFG